MKKLIITTSALLISFLFLQLSSGKPETGNGPFDQGSKQGISTDKGLGPFQNVVLKPVDKEKVKTGSSIFSTKCILCHELDTKKVGPPLREVTKNYHPEFILNMIVNPVEMQKSDPAVKELLKAFNNVPMPDQKISQQDALAILDYLRSVAK